MFTQSPRCARRRRRPEIGRTGGRLVFLAALLAAAPVQAEPGDSQIELFGGVGGGSFLVPVRSYRDIPFRTVVRQQYDYSCGSAAVATLLRHHYGVEVSEAEIFQAMYEVGDQARIREVGFSMLDMKNYLEARGFQADGFRITLDRLNEIGAPGIALITHDGYRHFVVIKGVEGDQVLVGDPTFGLMRVDRAEFESYWNGVVLAVRQAPAGFEEPVFDNADEWRPWTRPPIEMAPGAPSPAEILRELPPLYQITPEIVLTLPAS